MFNFVLCVPFQVNALRGRLRADETSSSAEQNELLEEVRQENEKERALLESQNEALIDEISQLRNQVNELQVHITLLWISVSVTLCYCSVIIVIGDITN